MTVDITGTDLTHRVVLAGLATLNDADETPAHAGEIRQACTETLDSVAGDVLGTLDKAAVSRSLNELEAETLVEATRAETSATGKGRPRYDIAVDRTELLDTLAEDDRVSPLLERADAR